MVLRLEHERKCPLNADAKPKRPRGRPVGTTKLGEKKTKTLHLELSPTGYQWAKAQGRGWLANWIETQARS